MGKTEEIRSRYILSALEDHCLNGDAYVTEDILYKRCRDQHRSLSYEVFKADLAEQIRQVTPERICAAAQSIGLDTVYFLRGKEGE